MNHPVELRFPAYTGTVSSIGVRVGSVDGGVEGTVDGGVGSVGDGSTGEVVAALASASLVAGVARSASSPAEQAATTTTRVAADTTDGRCRVRLMDPRFGLATQACYVTAVWPRACGSCLEAAAWHPLGEMYGMTVL
jgi:hypothetical protein